MAGYPAQEVNCRCVAIPVFSKWVQENIDYHQTEILGTTQSTDNYAKKITDLYDKVNADPSRAGKLFVDLGRPNESTILAAKESLGLDISDWQHCVDGLAIRHALKRHGDIRTELMNGQRAVTKSDFARLADIIFNFDSIEYTGINDSGNESFLIKKRIGDEIHCVQEVRNGRRKIAVKTMWIKKEKTTKSR